MATCTLLYLSIYIAASTDPPTLAPTVQGTFDQIAIALHIAQWFIFRFSIRFTIYTLFPITNKSHWVNLWQSTTAYSHLLVVAQHDYTPTTESIRLNSTCSAITTDFTDSDRNGEWRRFSTCNDYNSYKHVDNNYYIYCNKWSCSATWMTGTHCSSTLAGHYYYGWNNHDDWKYFGGSSASGSITWYPCTDGMFMRMLSVDSEWTSILVKWLRKWTVGSEWLAF